MTGAYEKGMVILPKGVGGGVGICERRMRKEPDGHRRRAGGVLIVLMFSSMILGATPPPPRRYVSEIYPNAVNTNIVSITLKATGELPEFMATSVRPERLEFKKEQERAVESFRAALGQTGMRNWFFPFESH